MFHPPCHRDPEEGQTTVFLGTLKSEASDLSADPHFAILIGEWKEAIPGHCQTGYMFQSSGIVGSDDRQRWTIETLTDVDWSDIVDRQITIPKLPIGVSRYDVQDFLNSMDM